MYVAREVLQLHAPGADGARPIRSILVAYKRFRYERTFYNLGRHDRAHTDPGWFGGMEQPAGDSEAREESINRTWLTMQSIFLA